MKSTYFSSVSLAVNSKMDIICKDFMNGYENFAKRNNRSKEEKR